MKTSKYFALAWTKRGPKIALEYLWRKFVFFMNPGEYKYPHQLMRSWEECYIEGDYDIPVKDAQIILDVGASSGGVTHYFRNRYPDAMIYSFEPSDAGKDIMQDRYTIAFRVAIDKKVGKRAFYVRKGAFGNSFYKKKGYHKVMVQTAPLSKFITEDVDILKIDVEGAEADILEDLYKNKLFTKVKNILIEVHFQHPDWHKALGILHKAGYTIRMKSLSLKNYDKSCMFWGFKE